ncbi:MAG: DUF4395 family protein [Armatimonadota bacterium]|nr:DUF4395 family protein [Armatimonadota bacterium]MDR7421071.1 DUF4395 family protein [Armatimonadota bacterium]MDR7453202.1 DUF4395 family protein [Armatimonadota bacterium]MDR7457919.1 DUF4395 family protein [Armatimonadota bacterium]MDR7495529.1 DUF4395 family protein [Armatimonadota bacterium]
MAAQLVDRTAIRFAQTLVVGGVALAAALGAAWPLAVLAAALAASAAAPARSPLRALYARVAVPLRLVRPNPVPDDPAPHRFAQGVGAAVLALATVAFAAGSPAAGWTLAALVGALALLNLTRGFCAGCFLYGWLVRLGWFRLFPRQG